MYGFLSNLTTSFLTCECVTKAVVIQQDFYWHDNASCVKLAKKICCGMPFCFFADSEEIHLVCEMA